MTEDEAKTKWCPFARVMVTSTTRDGEIAAAAANQFENDKMTSCIASACMAWRWNGFATIATAENPQGSGHCGLAGNP